jgi:hypothetical protein
MKKFKVGELRLDEKTLNEDLGTGNTIFVGSSTDMFADAVPIDWINQVLDKCRKSDNTYLFQSKNPMRFTTLNFPPNSILGTTFETNRPTNTFAPQTPERVKWMIHLRNCINNGILEAKLMVSIEPIMNFDLDEMMYWLKGIKPDFVSIGADSGNNYLLEPDCAKTRMLIDELKKITDVRIKDNMGRLIKGCNMFDEGKTYWFCLKNRPGFKTDEIFKVKGKVIEENSFMVKIQPDNGNAEIIPLNRILDVNEARNTEYTPGTKLNETEGY